MNLLSIEGRPCKVHKNTSSNPAALDEESGLIPWGAQPDVRIDRFDARSMLDMYREYDAETAPRRPKTEQEERLQKVGGGCRRWEGRGGGGERGGNRAGVSCETSP